jgi:NADH:ubiquinone oxidoreductase subunit 2 (subunit N)
LSLTVLLFSLAGIPPFGGFFGKFYIFLACLSSYKYITMFILFIFSILACLYYLRIVHIMYFRVHPGVVFMENYGFLSSYLLVLMVIFNMIMLGFLNTGLFTMLFEGVVENFIYEKV